MPCPPDNELMNYNLGRSLDPGLRAHVAGCKKCRRTLARLEEQLLTEGLETKGQASYSFALQRRPDSESAAG